MASLRPAAGTVRSWSTTRRISPTTASCRTRKVAFVHVALPGTQLPSTYEKAAQACAAHGLTTSQHWVHAVSLASPQWAIPLMGLMMRRGDSERPDALVITDDNLVPQVTAGLAAAGVQVPGDVDVVAHANFPYPTPSAVPVIRLGFSIRQAFHTAVKLIDLQRQGGGIRRRTCCATHPAC